ncbi:MAG TPA: NAD(P)H-dependent oxidoreductase subunit E [Longilinea sp.]|nr:NAD(P)H-dependent oxidoreductase subunit E [Longilinea sp.]
MNQLLSQFSDEVRATLAKYPTDQKRSAVMPLLHLAQSRNGYITKQSLADIAEILNISVTDVTSIVGFYTLYHEEGGRYHIQVCTDLPCALRGADDFLAKLCENLGIKVGETTPDGLVTIEEVTCLAGCHRAPMFQLQGDGEITYHENQTIESALKLVDGLKQSAAAKEEKP